MHSKWQVWDFFRSLPDGVGHSKGLYAFSFYSPFFQSILLDKIKSLSAFKDNFRIIHGSQCTKAWIEDNLCSLSLFGSTDHIIILKCEDLAKDCQELISSLQETSDRFVICLFENENALFKTISKLNQFTVHSIEEPKFWDYNKLLDYMSLIYGVRLSFEAKQLILKNVTHSTHDFANTLNILKLNFENVAEVNIEMINSVIKISRFDQFELATMVSKKQTSNFYELILKMENDFDMLRSIFSFLQTHLIKIADPTYIEKKKSPSKYDKEIMANSKIWKPIEVKTVISKFAQYEILAKKRSPSLIQLLQRDYLRSFM